MTRKTQEIDGKSGRKEDAWGEYPVTGAGAPASGAPHIVPLTAFPIDFLRFKVHF